jgi:hypothetical protein
MMSWRVIYPCGDRRRLAIAQVRDYEESDWDIASRQEFSDEEECREYMVTLAEDNNLEYEGQQRYLD